MKAQSLTEALKFSQVRPFLKSWDKNRFSEIFKKLPYKSDHNSYRLFVPLETQPQTDIIIPQPIQDFLDKNNYEMLDYTRGIVQNRDKKQPIKLGKVLTKAGEQNILNLFNTDPQRESKRGDYIVVISRHPYDIAGMSTDRGWTSCMNLITGMYKKYVLIDIKSGTIIAYVTKNTDKNLNNPTARILIKPFIDRLGSDKVFFVPESYCYGTDVPGFSETVEKITNQINQQLPEDLAIFAWDDKLYTDSSIAKQKHITGSPKDKLTLQTILDNPQSILKLTNPSETLLAAALTRDPKLIQYYNNPNTRLQIVAVSHNPDTLRLIPVPQGRINEQTVDKSVLEIALTNKPSLINYIETPSQELLQFMIDTDFTNIRLIKHKLDSKTLKQYKTQYVNQFITDNSYTIEDDRVVIETYREITDLATDYKLSTLKYYSKIIEDGYYEANYDIDTSYSLDDIKTTLTNNEPKIIEQLREIVFKKQLDDETIDQTEYDEKDISDIIDEDESGELNDLFRSAARRGIESGTLNEITEAVESWINNSTVIQLKPNGNYAIAIPTDTVFNEIISNIDESDETLDFDNIFPDFKNDYLNDLDEPYYGFDGWDIDAAMDDLTSELENFISNNLNESTILRLKKLSGIK